MTSTDWSSDENCSGLIVLFKNPGMLYILGREVIEGFQQGSIMTRAADSLESGPKSGQPRESVNSKGRCAQFLTYMSEQCMFLCKQHDL